MLMSRDIGYLCRVWMNLTKSTEQTIILGHFVNKPQPNSYCIGLEFLKNVYYFKGLSCGIIFHELLIFFWVTLFKYFLSEVWFFTTSKKYCMLIHTPSYNIKTKRYTFWTVSNIDIEESFLWRRAKNSLSIILNFSLLHEHIF